MSKEKTITGVAGSTGIAIGEAAIYRRNNKRISSDILNDDLVEKHVSLFKKAKKIVQDELGDLLNRQNEENTTELIQTQLAILSDPDLNEKIEQNITKRNRYAGYAIHHAFEEYLDVIDQQANELMKERSVDITDIRDRLIEIVTDNESSLEVKDGAILVAGDLSPREVIKFSEQHLKGIVMDQGGTTSHAAIIARSMNIPAVVGSKRASSNIESGQPIILDGKNGKIVINPEKSTLRKYQEMLEKQNAAQPDLNDILEKKNETTDGHPFSLFANIEFIEELDAVTKYGAEGIGLLRTESIYMRNDSFRQKQQSFYNDILKHQHPQPVTIRLLDTGGDKIFNENNEEQNPFLGWRGIRMLLDEENLLREQLRAILKTSAQYTGSIRILVPMVSTLDEVQKVKNIIDLLSRELSNEGVTVDPDLQFGIMVEVPSVAIQAELYAREVDFLSIGTNDLTQYLLAVDRGNEFISDLYDHRHPAVWMAIKQIADAAQKTNTPLSVCGELASDPVAACILMGLGIRELSMNPAALPAVKQILSSKSLKDMQELSKKVLECEKMDKISRLYSKWGKH